MGEYELILMLDPEVAEETRNGLADSAKQRIEGKGEIRHADSWGVRKMAYEIEREGEADYRFFRFTGDKALLDELDHNLKIADGIVRFRIFKVDPRSPIMDAPEVWTAPARREDGGKGRRGDDDRGSDSARGDSRERPVAEPAAAADSEPAAPEAGEPEAAEAPAADEAPVAPEAPEAPVASEAPEADQ